jgi:P27 family predicted phage terminase small subunit
LKDAKARRVWEDIVASVSADHFSQGDRYLLMQLADGMARYFRLRNAIERLPLTTENMDKQRQRRGLVAERNALAQHLVTVQKALRLGPASRRRIEAARTDMPTRNNRKSKAPGDDLFAC